MSVDGSPLWRASRWIAQRTLSDTVRRSVKNSFSAFQILPARIIGIARILESQAAEIRRLKSRLIILDGKFNQAIYGLPVSPEYKAQLISSPMLSSIAEVASIQENIRKAREHVFPGPQNLSSYLTHLNPESWLALGADRSKNLQEIQKAFPGINRSILIDPHSRAQGFTEYSQTDYLTGVLARTEQRFDLITCLDVIQRLSPLEQFHFLYQTQRLLSPRGALLISVPNLQEATVATDLYWADPLTNRSYSLSMLEQILRGYGNDVRVERQKLHVVIRFAK
jgi:hypothetical protein